METVDLPLTVEIKIFRLLPPWVAKIIKRLLAVSLTALVIVQPLFFKAAWYKVKFWAIVFAEIKVRLDWNIPAAFMAL